MEWKQSNLQITTTKSMCRNKRHLPGSWQLLAIFERDGLTIYEIHRLTQSHEGTHDSGKLQVGSVCNLLDPGFSQKSLFAQPHHSKPHENFPLNFCCLLVVFFLWILYAFLRKGESSHTLHGEPVGHQGNVWNWVTFLALCSNYSPRQRVDHDLC